MVDSPLWKLDLGILLIAFLYVLIKGGRSKCCDCGLCA